MATTKPLHQRFDVNRIISLLVGLLCGVILMIGINAIHPLTHSAKAPVIMLAAPSGAPEVIGGRLGGIDSADTANDAVIRQGLSGSASQIQVHETPVIGGRLGGLESSDTPNDATIKQNLRRVVGPGEGLHQAP